MEDILRVLEFTVSRPACPRILSHLCCLWRLPSMSDEQDDVDMEDHETDDETDPWDRRSWTTDEQWRWLQKTRPPYLAAQKARKLGKYLTTMQREYLLEWSECLQLFGHRDVDRLTEEQRDQLREAERKKKKVSHEIDPSL